MAHNFPTVQEISDEIAKNQQAALEGMRKKIRDRLYAMTNMNPIHVFADSPLTEEIEQTLLSELNEAGWKVEFRKKYESESFSIEDYFSIWPDPELLKK